MCRHRSKLQLLLVLALLAGAFHSFAAQAVAVPSQLIRIEEGFAYDMNAQGDYVLAWSSTGKRAATKVLRGSVTSGVSHIWTVASGLARDPDVAISENGTMALGWVETRRGKSSELWTKNGAVWNASDVKVVPHVLDRVRSDFFFDDIGDVDVAINDAGGAAFTWVTGFRSERIGFAVGHAHGVFTVNRTIFRDRKAGHTGNPEISIDNAGNSVVRWTYLGVDCANDFFVPRRCRDQASSLAAVRVSASSQASSPQWFGEGCHWSDHASTTDGRSVSLTQCRRGLRYTTATAGQPFSASQKLSGLPGRDPGIDHPQVSLLADGRIIIVYESAREAKGGGWITQLAGFNGTFGAPLGPAIAFTPEVDHSEAEDQGGYFGARPSIVEGPNAQPYVSWFGEISTSVAPLGPAGNLGLPVVVPVDSSATGAHFDVVNSGVGFAIWAEETRGFQVRVLATTFTPPLL